MRRIIVVSFVVASALSSAACNKSSATENKAGAESKKEKAGCGDADLQSKEGGFCVTLPKGYTPNDPEAANDELKTKKQTYSSPGGHTFFEIEYGPSAAFDEYRSDMDSFSKMASDGGGSAEQGDLSPAGHWTKLQYKGDTTIKWEYLYKLPKGMARCQVTQFQKQDKADEVTACKSIKPL